MEMINVVVLEGNLGSDAEQKQTTTGRSLVTFRIANNRTWKNKSGEKQSETVWMTVTSWNENTKGILAYLTKGRHVKVIGRLHANTYQDKDGNNRTTYDVVADNIILGSSPETEDSVASPAPKQPQQTLKSRVQQKRVEDDDSWDGDDDESDSTLPW